MMMKTCLVGSALILAIAARAEAPAAGAGAAGGGHGEGPCKKVVEACAAAGFKKGDWKNGDGLFRDCVDPIMQGTTKVPGATKALPSVPADVVSACKAKHPKFGSGKVGS